MTETAEPVASSATKDSFVVRFGKFFVNHLIAILFFVGLPALVTAIAPVAWVKFERQNDVVTARAQTCLLFLVPYRTSVVTDVVQVGDRVVAGTVHRERRPGPDRETRSEDEGFLVIQGAEQTAEVQVSPASLQSVQQKVNAFLSDPQAKVLKLFVVANWKFSVIGGGLISLMAVFYFGLVAFSILQLPGRLVRWATGSSVPPAAR